MFPKTILTFAVTFFPSSAAFKVESWTSLNNSTIFSEEILKELALENPLDSDDSEFNSYVRDFVINIRIGFWRLFRIYRNTRYSS